MEQGTGDASRPAWQNGALCLLLRAQPADVGLRALIVHVGKLEKTAVRVALGPSGSHG